MGRAPRRTLSPERKGLYAVGLGLQGIGAMGFLVCLLGFAFGGMRSAQSFGREGSPVQWWAGALLCMVALVIGGMLRGIAARGVAGSGLVLDPERARTDLEPWARTGGATDDRNQPTTAVKRRTKPGRRRATPGVCHVR